MAHLSVLTSRNPREIRTGEGAMEVGVSYQPAQTLDFPAGSIDLAPALEIDLRWPDVADDQDFVCADISATVTAIFTASDRTRLLALSGEIADLGNWRLAPALVGEFVWGQVIVLLGETRSSVIVEVEPAQLLTLGDAWTDLRNSGKARRVVGLASRRRLGDEVAIVASDPEFFRRGWELVRRLLQQEPPEP